MNLEVLVGKDGLSHDHDYDDQINYKVMIQLKEIHTAVKMTLEMIT